MLTREIMSGSMEVIQADHTLGEAAGKMKTFNIGAIPVMEGDKLVGMLTDRDITVRAVAEGRNPSVTRVGDVMSRGAFYCYDDQDVKEVVRLMEDRKVRRIVVVNRERKPVGIVSLGDIAVHGSRDLACEALEKVSVVH